MGRRTPHTGLNRNNEFYENGQLKAGYSYEGGPGMVARGTGSYNVQSGAGKDGLSYKVEQRTIYGKAPTAAPSAPAPAPAPAPAAAAPAPQPEPEKAEPVGTSDTLQNANDFLSNYKKSGFNFKNTTQGERKELTDSFNQKPAYDPNAGVSSPEAGNFLDDYKLNLKDQINKVRTEATNKLNPNPNGGE